MEILCLCVDPYIRSFTVFCGLILRLGDHVLYDFCIDLTSRFYFIVSAAASTGRVIVLISEFNDVPLLILKKIRCHVLSQRISTFTIWRQIFSSIFQIKKWSVRYIKAELRAVIDISFGDYVNIQGIGNYCPIKCPTIQDVSRPEIKSEKISREWIETDRPINTQNEVDYENDTHR